LIDYVSCEMVNCCCADFAVSDGPRESRDAEVSERDCDVGPGGAEEHGRLVILPTSL